MDLEFGIRLPMNLADIAGYAQRVEALHFDYLVCGEHMMFHGPTANAFIALAVAAGATERIKLLSAITLLPLYPPVIAAKMTAALDFASNGRFHLGIGSGGEYPKEFEACGSPIKERGARTNEALEVITRLLDSQEPVSFSGRFTQFSEGRIQPAPMQKPHPPIWVAGRQESAMRRAARWGDYWLPYMYTPEMLRESITKIRSFAADYGRDPDAIQPAIYGWVTTYADGEKARRVCSETLGKIYNQDMRRAVDRYQIAGSPSQCIERLRGLTAMGCRAVILALACPPEETESMLEMLSTEILPEFGRQPNPETH